MVKMQPQTVILILELGASGATSRAAAKVPAAMVKMQPQTVILILELGAQDFETSKPGASKTGLESSANHVEHPASNHGRSNDYVGTEMKHRLEDEAQGKILQEAQETLRSQSGYGEEKESNVGRNEMKEAGENVKHASRNPDHRDKVIDDDDLIERELEDGIESAAQSDKNKQDRRQNWSKPSVRSNNGIVLLGRHQDHVDEHHHGIKSLSSSEPDLSTVEGEVSALDDIGPGLLSPKSGNRKRKASTSPDRVLEWKPHYPNNRFHYMEDRNQVQENHV
ncbi:hypothetical protein K1719_010644 [Acacia pycnantha]|nr:hypothetical protein K1719_010644 [Acacia pycnantha]